MKLLMDPAPKLAVFCKDLDIVIHARDGGIPETYVEEGSPRPDRHMLLGIVQAAVIAVEESDNDSVATVSECPVMLRRLSDVKNLDPNLIVVKSGDGEIGVLAAGDSRDARRRVRDALRYFTGTVRLDVP